MSKVLSFFIGVFGKAKSFISASNSYISFTVGMLAGYLLSPVIKVAFDAISFLIKKM